ncbi:hypothetical protein BZA05DRAFT_449030 [Tricharina praecox]|uniref:uncharacterized protein n=1 Tax=Tricharina praecox TaxID=43433 RepID=UPI00221F3BFE|nr:uncharacterized protein BZA05DRAFT_449030 [Tricharina praecox]KAI5842771.1 hypothetical protein BZA05DRAFT_449030 [Tricharina praecox]
MAPKRPTAAHFMKSNPNVDSKTPTNKSIPVQGHTHFSKKSKVDDVLNPSPTNRSSNFVEGVVSKYKSTRGVGNTNNTTPAPDISSAAKNDVITGSNERPSITRTKNAYVINNKSGTIHALPIKRVPKAKAVGDAAKDKNTITSGVTKDRVVIKRNAVIKDKVVTKGNAVTQENAITKEEVRGRRRPVQPFTTKDTTTENSRRRRSDSVTKSRSISPARPPKDATVTSKPTNAPMNSETADLSRWNFAYLYIGPSALPGCNTQCVWGGDY